VSVQTVLPNAASSPAAARHVLAEALRDGCGSETIETAQLLLSEVVTNAVLHAQGEIHVSVACDGGRVRVEVADASRNAPAPRRASAHATTGRGMMLVDAIAAAWGVERRPPGKVVWFEVVEEQAS
jgi:anti-sigma regulatory factor (Ser/Thr protein kinase)